MSMHLLKEFSPKSSLKQLISCCLLIVNWVRRLDLLSALSVMKFLRAFLKGSRSKYVGFLFYSAFLVAKSSCSFFRALLVLPGALFFFLLRPPAAAAAFCYSQFK